MFLPGAGTWKHVYEVAIASAGLICGRISASWRLDYDKERASDVQAFHANFWQPPDVTLMRRPSLKLTHLATGDEVVLPNVIMTSFDCYSTDECLDKTNTYVLPKTLSMFGYCYPIRPKA